MRLFDGAFGVRHHAEHIAFGIQNTGDVALRAVAVFDVAEGDTPFAFEHVERFVVGEIIAVMVRDGNIDGLARFVYRW